MATIKVVKEAIAALNDRNGSSVLAINRWIESEKRTTIKKHVMKACLKKAVEDGTLVLMNASYKLSPQLLFADESIGLNVPTSVESARTQLTGIVARPVPQHSERRLATCTHVLNCVKLYPQLAKEHFKQLDGTWVYPLVCLLQLRATLRQFQEMYELFPTAAQKTLNGGFPRNGGFPLHLACALGASPGVTEFLATQYPQAAAVASPRLPLEMLLTRPTRAGASFVKQVQALIDAYPMGVMGSKNRPCCLVYTLRSNYPLDAVRAIVKAMVSLGEKGSLFLGPGDHGEGINAPLSETGETAVLELLPSLKKLSLRLFPESGMKILSSLSANHSVRELLLSLDFLEEVSRREFCVHLRQLLKSNVALEKLTLARGPYSFGVYDEVLLAFTEHPTHPSLGHLVTNTLTFRQDALLQFLHHGNLPEKVNLKDLVILSPPEESLDVRIPDLPPAAMCASGSKLLKHLTLQVTSCSEQHFIPIASQIGAMDHLESFVLDTSSVFAVDMTGTATSLLAAGNLQRLELLGSCRLDVQTLCGVLKTNTSLHSFKTDQELDDEALKSLGDVMKHYNTTLQSASLEISDWSEYYKLKTIGSYALLNLFGRQKAEDPNTSIEGFVSLLCNVASAEFQSFDIVGLSRVGGMPLVSAGKLNVFYELLQGGSVRTWWAS